MNIDDYTRCPVCGQFIFDKKTRQHVAQFESEGFGLDIGLSQSALISSILNSGEPRVILISTLSGPIKATLAFTVPVIVASSIALAHGVINEVLASILILGSFSAFVLILGSNPSIIESTAKEVEIQSIELPAVIQVERDANDEPGFDLFHKIDVRYPSNDSVPDLYLWKMAEAHMKSGVPFSRQMYQRGIVTRPAFEAFRDRLVEIHYARYEGQDIALSPRALNLFREWLSYPKPTPLP